MVELTSSSWLHSQTLNIQILVWKTQGMLLMRKENRWEHKPFIEKWEQSDFDICYIIVVLSDLTDEVVTGFIFIS